MSATSNKLVKQTNRTIKRHILNEQFDLIEKAKRDNATGRIPNGFINSLIENAQPIAPWLTYHIIMGYYRKRMKENKVRKPPHFAENEYIDMPPLSHDNSDDDSDDEQPLRKPPHSVENNDIEMQPLSHNEGPLMVRGAGGRPKGSTDKKRRIGEVAIVAAVNEITCEFKRVYDRSNRKNKRVKRGYLLNLIKRIKTKNNIPDNVNIRETTIRQRVKRKRVFTNGSRGHESPLLPIESTVVKLIIQLSRIRQCLTPSQGLSLVNSLIDDTPVQEDLIAFKNRFCCNKEGKVGRSYWRAFMKRNGHLIVSKKGQKYELDRASWSTYHNFAQMYSSISDEMVDSKVAIELEAPVWMDSLGNEVLEESAFGCKVTHDITRRDICFVMDEVGGNISQKGDGNIGGQLQLCENGKTPQEKISTKDKHYTVLGVTNLDGEAVMCVVILAGVDRIPLVETGLDLFAPVVGDVSDSEFFKANSGPGKRFPGGPTCQFKGKEIPCLTRWSKKGGITSEILIAILQALDETQIFDEDRENGVKPLLLVDGHGSRFEIPFLRYISDDAHEWTVVIGVPYGTALWQVGDSPEQNGSFNMASVQVKKELVEQKEMMMLASPNIEAHDIMTIISRAWYKSFHCVDSNKKAIAERGWFPYNRNLMTYPIIRSSITKEEKDEEISTSSEIVLPLHKRVEITDLCDPSTQVIDFRFASKPIDEAKMRVNFDSGKAAFCLDKIVMNHDLQEARSRIMKRRDEGKTLEEKLREMKRFTAGKLFNAKTCRVGRTMLEVHEENVKAIEDERKRKESVAALKYREYKAESDKLLLTGVLPQNMNRTQLRIILLPLKRKEDGAMPTVKAKMIAAYESWKERQPPVFNETNELVSTEEQSDDVEDMDASDVAELTNVDNDVIEAMMTLGSA